MKTDNIPPGDVIWPNNVDLLPDVGCLPVIGGCQISSILSNLDAPVVKSETPIEPHQNVDLISLNGGDLRLPAQMPPPPPPSNHGTYTTSSTNSRMKTNINFENILYFVCDMCPFLCIKNSKINEHMENAHKNKTTKKLPHLKCPGCANVFFHKMSLRSHLIHDHGVGNSDLGQIIQAVVSLANKLKAEENKHKNLRPKVIFDITLPFETKATTVALPKVEIGHNTEIIFNTMMSKPNSVTKLIGAKKMHRCLLNSCKVQFHSLDNLNYHTTCHKDNGFVCLVCSETFGLWKPLASHLWRLHKIDMELHSCDKCDYKSVSLAKLNNIHKLIHGEAKSFVCGICKKGFKNTKQLSNHKNTHKSQYERLKYPCNVCQKSFFDKRQLKIHMDVVHEKIKPFLCSYCGYKGSSKSSLKMHVRQHTGEKPFACDSCSYTTSDHNSLRRHKLRHSGHKPYKCSYCSYACIQSSTYKVHLKTKHPGQEKDLMFTCSECQFRSVNKDAYVLHMVTVHDQKPPS